MNFMFNNIYIGTYMVTVFGYQFVAITAVTVLMTWGMTRAHRAARPWHEENGKLHGKNGTMLHEVFNNLKMIKLYGWQLLFRDRIMENRKKIEEMEKKIDRYHDKIGKIQHITREMFCPLNLCLYVWYGNTFDIAFVTIVQDYFWRILHTYNFIPDFMNYQSDRKEQEDNLLELFKSPDVQENQ